MPPQYTTDDVARFCSKIDTSGDCWEWTACKLKAGYGTIYIQGSKILTHRFAYLITYGILPDNMLVCHTCDNPPCVNPDHLFLGTYTDNVQDMLRKGRRVSNVPRGDDHYFRQHPELMPRGEQHGRALLTDNQVREMRQCYNNGDSLRTLTQRYSVSKSTVYHIVIGDTWKHLL